MECILQNSIDYVKKNDWRDLEKDVQADLDELPYDMRNSHKFVFDQTRAHIAPRGTWRQSEIDVQRRSLKQVHQDLGLDHHTKHVKVVNYGYLRPRDSEKPKIKHMKEIYFEDHELTLQSQKRLSKFNKSVVSNESLPISCTSNTYQKRKINFLKQKAKNH